MLNLIPACIWWYMNMIYDMCHISWLEIDCMSGKAVHRLVKYSPGRFMTALSRYWGRSHNRPWEYDGISLVEMQCVEIVGFCFCHPLSTLGHSPHDAKQLKSVTGYTAINLVPGQAPPVWSRVGFDPNDPTRNSHGGLRETTWQLFVRDSEPYRLTIQAPGCFQSAYSALPSHSTHLGSSKEWNFVWISPQKNTKKRSDSEIPGIYMFNLLLIVSIISIISIASAGTNGSWTSCGSGTGSSEFGSRWHHLCAGGIPQDPAGSRDPWFLSWNWWCMDMLNDVKYD